MANRISGRWQEAVEAVREPFRLKPDVVAAGHRLAYAQFLSGDRLAALQAVGGCSARILSGRTSFSI